MKFLNKERKNTIKAGNMKNYLMYAAGEILLVVVGILLALQINNWNAERVNRRTEQEYIMRLTQELKSDLNFFKKVQARFGMKENQLRRIIAIWQSNDPHITDSLQYINDYLAAGDISPWYNEPVTWNQLIQTGDLKLIHDQDLVVALYDHHNGVKRVADNYLQYPMQMTNRARELWSKPFMQEDLDEFLQYQEMETIPSPNVYENIWENRMDYLNLYISITYISLGQQEKLTDVIKSGNKLLQLLEAQKSPAH